MVCCLFLHCISRKLSTSICSYSHPNTKLQPLTHHPYAPWKPPINFHYNFPINNINTTDCGICARVGVIRVRSRISSKSKTTDAGSRIGMLLISHVIQLIEYSSHSILISQILSLDHNPTPYPCTPPSTTIFQYRPLIPPNSPIRNLLLYALSMHFYQPS